MGSGQSLEKDIETLTQRRTVLLDAIQTHAKVIQQNRGAKGLETAVCAQIGKLETELRTVDHNLALKTRAQRAMESAEAAVGNARVMQDATSVITRASKSADPVVMERTATELSQASAVLATVNKSTGTVDGRMQALTNRLTMPMPTVTSTDDQDDMSTEAIMRRWVAPDAAPPAPRASSRGRPRVATRDDFPEIPTHVVREDI
jgi:hypothetical protein